MTADPLVLMAEVDRATDRLLRPAAALDDAAWTTVLDIPGAPQPAARVVWRRLREVEVHHVDLAAGAVAAWLIGRSAGTDLTISPEGPLPTPPNWI